MIYGYTRISTPKQSLKRQADNIKKYDPAAVIVPEIYSGRTTRRPKWEALKRKLQPGDVIIFDEISRMSRNAAEGYTEYRALYDKDINLIFLKEPTLNTENFRQAAAVAMTGTDIDIILEAVNKYLFLLAEQQIKTAFEAAEKEVTLLRQRTKEGVEKARAEGKQIGRPKGVKMETEKGRRTMEIIKKHCKEYGGSLTDRELMQLAGVSKKTFYKYKKIVHEEDLLERLKQGMKNGEF